MWKSKLQILLSLGLFAVALVQQTSSSAATPTPASESKLIPGYPGVLSHDYIRVVVEDEIRTRMRQWALKSSAEVHASSSNSKNTTSSSGLESTTRIRQRRNAAFEIIGGDESENIRQQNQETIIKQQQQEEEQEVPVDNDLTGLNDILQTFNFDIPETNIAQDFLGSTMTLALKGTCGGVGIEQMELDYTYDETSLTYLVDVTNLNISCILDIDWDTGEYDIEDTLQVRLPLVDSDFSLDVKLNGKPPQTTNFLGCQVEVHVGNVSSIGGFSSDVVNDLGYWWQDIIENEKATISGLVCDALTGFTDLVDGLLMNLTAQLEPFLEGNQTAVDPLELEKNLIPDEPLVDLKNSTLGDILNSLVTNIRGVFGAHQINTLIELNLIDENGLFTFNLSSPETDANATNSTTSQLQQMEGEDIAIVEDGSSPFRRRQRHPISTVYDEFRQRFLQTAETNDTAAAETNSSFTLNDLQIFSVQIDGLNTFSDNNLQLLDIIGQYTVQSKLELGNVSLRVNMAIDLDFNGISIQEDSIEVFVPLRGISLSVSFLIGLSKRIVEKFSLGVLLGADDLFGCLSSSLVTAGFSELGVVIGGVGVPLIKGLVSPGVDNLIGTAIEAAVLAYQDLILQAIPNIFQFNLTSTVNEFVESFIRDNLASEEDACPPPAEILDSFAPDGFFSFTTK